MKKSFLASFLIACICFGVIFTGVDRLGLASIFDDTEVEAKSERDDLNIEAKDPKIDKSVLVLLMGVDGTDVLQEKGLRTDTIMLAKANFETGDINILSIPRDSRVEVNGKMDKINHAHSYGGPGLAIKTVEDFLDLDIDYYVKVDFSGVKEIVDAIGGVELDVPVRMKYNDPTAKPPLRINLQPGLQTLDGQKAHDYLRFRRYPEGDVGRVKAQQYFMKELAKQVLKPSNIFNLDKLIKTYYDYVDTNIPMSKMLKYSMSAGKLDTENLRTEMVPGEGRYIGDVSYYIYDEVGKEQIVDELFSEYKR